MAEEVKFRITIDDNGSQVMKEISVNGEDLAQAFEKLGKTTEKIGEKMDQLGAETRDAFDQISSQTAAASESMGKLNTEVVNFASLSQGIDAVTSIFGQLAGACNELTGYYQAQVVAETKLETSMRNTMNAADEEIQSIKDLCSAQQDLGVIGDEVQLAGAQEMATYLEEADSLRTLIPVMNDVIAQQYGLNASQESAAQIATMMGKVMEGQVGALSRYGYSFDEAQEQILKFGTESERAAVLAEVIENSVGGMNAALAQTDAGKQQQLANTLGDIKEQLGSLVQGVSPFVQIAADAANAAGGAIKAANALKTLSNMESVAAAKAKILAAHQHVVSAAQRILAATGITAAASTTALTVAVTALYSALTFGIAAVITAIVAAIASFNDEADEFVDRVDEAKEAMDSFSDTVTRNSAQLQLEIGKLKGLKDGTQQAADQVDHLNRTYGDIFGSHKTAAEWYDVLVAKSQAYCQQLGYEAQAKTIASQKAAKELELQANGDRMSQIIASGKNSNDAEHRELARQNGILIQDIVRLGKQFDACMQKAREASAEMDSVVVRQRPAATPTKTKPTKPEENYADGTYGALKKQLQDLQAQRMTATRENIGHINDEIAKVQELIAEMDKASSIPTLQLGEVSVTAPQQKDWSTVSPAEITTYEELNKVMDALEEKMQKATAEQRAGIQRQISEVKKLKNTWDAANDAIDKEINPVIKPEVDLSEAYKGMKGVKSAWSSIKGVSGGIENMTEALKGNGKAWKKAMAVVDSGIQIYESISTVMEMVNALTTAHAVAKGVEAAANTTEMGTETAANAATMAETAGVQQALAVQAAAWSAVAAAKTFATYAEIPFAGPAIAAGFVAAQEAAIIAASIPKFAKGTVAYGPTLGLFGEYPGASSNPEIVTPENKMREIIREEHRATIYGGHEKLTFRIRGRDLEATRKRRNRLSSRT